MSYVVFEAESDDSCLLALCLSMLLKFDNHHEITAFLKDVRLRKEDTAQEKGALLASGKADFHYTSGYYYFIPFDGLFVTISRSDTSMFSLVLRISIFGHISTIVPTCFLLYKTIRRCNRTSLFRNTILKKPSLKT